MLKQCLYISFFVLLFVSCRENVTHRGIAKLMSSPILLPTNALLTVNGKDSIIINYFNPVIKMVIYMDSSECSSCLIKEMFLWKPFINNTGYLREKFGYYFIFSQKSTRLDSLRSLLSAYPLNYPIMIDTALEFQKINTHLPKNRGLHAFMLNTENKVVFVGNPIYNQYYEKKFYEKVNELIIGSNVFYCR